MSDVHVIGGPGEGSARRHIWMEVAGQDPVALCKAQYDGRTVAPGANKNLPVCQLCMQVVDQHNKGARLGGRIEVR
jgi:hypothetical protein